MKRTLIVQVRQLAGNRCDYCHMPAEFDPLPFQFDHVIARQHGGLTIVENGAWSCLHCNKHTGRNIAGLDPLTGKLVALFHPRLQRWDRHFQWNGSILWGRTAIGRGTIRVLAINHPDVVAFRAELMESGDF